MRQGGQSCHKLAVQVLPFRRSLGGLVRLHQLVEPLRVVDRRGLPGSRLAGAVEACVDRDSMEPGGDRGLTTEGVRGTEGGHECVLHRVGCLFTVAECTERYGPETVAMPPDQLTEGVRIACDVLSQEILVAGVCETGVVQR